MPSLRRTTTDADGDRRRQTVAWDEHEWKAILDYAAQAGITPHGAVRELVRTNSRIGLKSLLAS